MRRSQLQVNPRRPLVWAALGLALAATLFLAFRVRLTVPPRQALAAGQELLREKTVLAVVPHPDDLEWYIGGTLRRLADAGADVQVIVASNGEKGPNRTGAPDLPAARRQEQLNAARINGYRQVHFLGLPDRGVARDARFLPEVEAIFRQVEPQAVFLFDPQFPALPYLHPDHQGSARAFLSFWRTLGPARPPVYLFQTRRPDVAVDISSAIASKVQALAQHRSQNLGGGEGVRRFYGGRIFGVAYAETFRRLR